MEDWQGWRVDRCYPSHKDLDDSMYFLCLCQFRHIMLSPPIVTSLTSRNPYHFYNIFLLPLSLFLPVLQKGFQHILEGNIL